MSLKMKSVLTALMLTAQLAASALPAAALTPPASSQQAVSDESDSPVKVVVSLKQDSLLEQFGSDALGTDETAGAADSIASQQKRVQKQIRSLYPALEVGASYNVLMNGFSCELPGYLIPQVEALQAVESVRILPEIQVPQMMEAPSLSGVPAFQQQTGCTGEGQVIAVVDSELCTDHPMFAALPDSVETRFSKDDIAELIGKNVLHKELDPDKTYLSSKLPYVIDYVDDPYEGVPNEVDYHGTHVSGIAAGNEFVTDSGRKISGIAKDAQIVFMGVGNGHGYVDTEAALLALEDAVVLHADVINMSWGSWVETYGDNVFADVLKAADQAGISICISAGNSDNGTNSLRRVNYPETPDVSTIDDKTDKDSCAFVVASADNSVSYQRSVLMLGDQKIVFSPFVTLGEGKVDYLTDGLEERPYEYVYYGELTSDDVQADNPEDLSGKLMVVKENYLSLDAVEIAAAKRSPAGLIIISDWWTEDLEGEYYFANRSVKRRVPTAVVSKRQGELLAEAAEKILTNPGTTVTQKSENKMSYYTSWGPSHSLDLRPDITGIGGSVESAAYGGQTEIMSGTSMASPHVAGCTALVREYLKKQGVTAEGTELLRYVRVLMMNTAVPYEEDGLLVTPRRQGAGQVALDRAMNSKVLLTNTDGDGKINLFDKNGDRFSFDVNLKNLSDEKVTFKEAKLCLTTDDTEYYEPYRCEIISGQRELRSTADLSALKSVDAGKSKSVKVSVSLDGEQTASIRELFVNGFFIDGFLLLTGAENCPDISVPICGYYGEWKELPVIREDNIGFTLLYGDHMFAPGLPLSEALPLISDILLRSDGNEAFLDWWDFDFFTVLYDNGSADELDKLKVGTSEPWISPNGDAIADFITDVNFETRRQSKVKFQIIDESGEIRYETETEVLPPWNESEMMPEAHPRETIPLYIDIDDMNDYEEGSYKIRMEFRINYSDMNKPVQTVERSFRVDKTAPEVSSAVVTEKGRKILKMDISDNGGLDCVFVLGNGKAEESQLRCGNQGAVNLLGMYCDMRRFGASGMFLHDASMDKPVPYVLAQLTSGKHLPDEVPYDYSDMIPLTPDASGICHVEYDVTDLTDYNFTVLDKAMNAIEVKSGENMIKEGVWEDVNRCLMEFSGNQVRTKSLFDGTVRTYRYTFSDNILTMTSPEETITRTLSFKSTNEASYREGDGDDFGRMEYYPSWDDPDKALSLEDISFFPANDLIAPLCALFEKRTDWHVEKCEVNASAIGSAAFTITTIEKEDVPCEGEIYAYVSLFTAIGSCDFMQGAFDLLSEEIDRIEPGIYAVPGYHYFMVFNEDGKTGTILPYYSDIFLAWVKEFENLPFTYTFDERKKCEIKVGEESHTAFFSVTPDGILQMNLNGGMVDLIRMEGLTPDAQKQFRTASEIYELCTAYERAVRSSFSGNGFYGNLDENGWGIYSSEEGSVYLVNPFTLEATDERGMPVDLNSPPTLPEGSASLEELQEQARQNYIAKTGRTDVTVYAKITPDRKVQISFWAYDPEDWDGEKYIDAGYVIEPVSTAVRGDMDCSGSFSIADCVMLARYLAEDPIAVTAQGLVNAETDGDPDALTTGDLSMMMQALAGTASLK